MPEPIIANPVTTTPPPPVTEPPTDPAAALRSELALEKAERAKADARAKLKEDELETIRMNGLKEKEDWKKVAQDYEKKFTESEVEKKGLSKAILVDKKMTAVREAAIKAGLLESALDDLELVDFPQVSVETTSTGRMNVNGVEAAIQWLKTKKGHWFGTAAPNVNGNSPGLGAPAGNKVSEADIIKASAEANASGDWSKVKELNDRYRKQA